MSKSETAATLFVKGLPADTSRNELHGIMSEFGVITEIRMTTTQSKVFSGTAFIGFTDSSSIERAARRLNNTSLRGSLLVVEEAHSSTNSRNKKQIKVNPNPVTDDPSAGHKMHPRRLEKRDDYSRGQVSSMDTLLVPDRRDRRDNRPPPIERSPATPHDRHGEPRVELRPEIRTSPGTLTKLTFPTTPEMLYLHKLKQLNRPPPIMPRYSQPPHRSQYSPIPKREGQE